MSNTENLNPDYVRWTKSVIQMLKIGGVFIIPRSGVRVKRIADDAVEIDQSVAYAPEPELEKYLTAAGFRVQTSATIPTPPSRVGPL